MRSRMALGLLSLLLAAAAAAPGVSDAAVTTIGPATLSTGTENSIFEGTFMEYSGMAPAPEYVSPIEGTIVTWRIASGSAAKVRLRVLRPAGAGKFTGVGSSALETTTGPPLDTFTTSLPIKVGDVIGIDNANQALIFTTKVPGDYPKVFGPAPLADGPPAAEPQTVSMGEGLGTELKLQINADIQPTPKGGGGGGGGGAGSGGGRGGSGVGGQPGSPTLAALKISPNTFGAGSGGSGAGSRKPKTGATVSYTDSQAATTTFTVLGETARPQEQSGRLHKPPRKPHGKPCARSVRIASFTHTDGAGANSFHFTGRVNGHRLTPGGYELQAVARNASGLTSKPVVTGFHVNK